MAAIFRVLGQLYPTANVETPLYTCGVNSAVVSSFIVCNSSYIDDIISARICVGNAPNDNKQLLYSNIGIPNNTVLELTAGLTFANSDVLKVISVNGTTTFQLFGQENS